MTAPASPDEKVGADELQRALLNCLQLHSAIEMLLRETDRLVEARLTNVQSDGDPSLPPVEQAALREMQRLLGDGLDDLIGSLTSGVPLDIDQSRAREIRLNTVEAELRRAPRGSTARHPASRRPQKLPGHRLAALPARFPVANPEERRHRRQRAAKQAARTAPKPSSAQSTPGRPWTMSQRWRWPSLLATDPGQALALTEKSARDNRASSPKGVHHRDQALERLGRLKAKPSDASTC